MFTDQVILAVWSKASEVKNIDPNEWRKDLAGAWIKFEHYGSRSSYGWEIDHVFPEAKGGGNELVNLRPLHWENNLKKSDDFPSYNTEITSEGNKNIRLEQSFTVNAHLIKALKMIYTKNPILKNL